MDMMGIKNPKIPYTIQRLGVEAANNDQGFRFIKTEYTQDPKEASFLTNGGKVIYNSKEDKLESSDERVSIWALSNQSGLRGLYRDRVDDLNAGYDSMLGSNDNGRVQIFQDPMGLVKKILDY